LNQPDKSTRGTVAILAYGFRPFFFMAGVHGAAALLMWLVFQVDALSAPGHWPAATWHGHEMLFGYAPAVLAGFLLTAVPNWIGVPPVRRFTLAALVALWLAGRAAVALAGYLPELLVTIVDCAFLPALMLLLLPPLIAHKKWRNVIFVVPLSALTLTNLALHFSVAGELDILPRDAFIVATGLFALFITVMGGRIIPSFTANVLRARGAEASMRNYAPLNIVAIVSLVAMIVADAVAPLSLVGAALALLAAVAGVARLSGWRWRKILDDPLLWILHLGYLALAIGLAMKGVAALTEALPLDIGLHMLTVGAIGMMTFGVMTRVVLGHTGRDLKLRPNILTAYFLLIAALILRLIAPFLPERLYNGDIHLSGGLWSAAFVIFLIVYAPMLWRSRPDGKRG
jgi:uncharacterized protein involved in response to NO